ncbi:DUF4085 family protein [Gottfriedia luciferensis]|uniref:DUF4085 family protein n=1 Tax=Gottfriedia luciferensis TaxID=178774 RepID=UPI000B450A3C|nr:DUF4085 family protein [Gottfriedia luciferensis]
MNYFTKEWYELMQRSSFHLLLEEESQAETFSEEYFQQLYKFKLNESNELRKEIAIFENEPYDKENSTKQFYEGFIYNQEHIKKNLPEKILKIIADVRVFVLDRASRNVINAVTQFCEENETTAKETIKEYGRYYSKSLKSFDKNMIENINFHDCNIVNIEPNKKSLILFLDSTGGFTDIDEIVFENYQIIKQDGSLANTWWLYDEIYKVNNKYEIHVLLQNENMDLIEFIISVENIDFKSNKKEED